MPEESGGNKASAYADYLSTLGRKVFTPAEQSHDFTKTGNTGGDTKSTDRGSARAGDWR